MRHLAMALIVLLMALAGCGGEPPAAVDLVGPWQLVSGTIDGQDLGIIETHPVTIEFNSENLASGTASCNGYSGTYQLADGAVAFGGLAQTEMACEPSETMDLESRYLSALSSVDSASIEGEVLNLSGPDTILEFTRLEPPPTPELLGSVWLLDGIQEGDTVTAVSGQPTLEFYSDGSFIADTGCRTISGNYVESGGGVMTTDMSAPGDCPPEISDQDRRVIDVLEAGYRVEITDGRMTLTVSGDEALIYRVRG